MSLQYTCPGCGTPLGYEGLCWKCKSEQERKAALAWTPEQITEKQRNLIRNIQRLAEMEDPEFTEMQGQLLGFLSHHPDREICQKDVEEAFCIRRSTASRLLKKLEAAGFITRRSVFRDARLKQVVLTPKAQKLHQQIEQRLDKMEELLTEGISDQELEQFMATVEKLKKNLS